MQTTEFDDERNLSILVVDDHYFFRKGILKILEFTKYGNSIFSEACNGADAIDISSQHKIDVIFLDERMPIVRGFEAARLILQQESSPEIIVTTLYDEAALIMNYLNIGVKGFLSKDEIDAKSLECALDYVVAGNIFISSKFKNTVSDWLNTSNKTVPPIRFSNRELEVVTEISKGSNSKKIAHDLNVSARTIETYRQDLLKKIGAKNSADLLSYFYKNGIL